MHARVAEEAVYAAEEAGGAYSHPEDVIEQPYQYEDAKDRHGQRGLLLGYGYPYFFRRRGRVEDEKQWSVSKRGGGMKRNIMSNGGFVDWTTTTTCTVDFILYNVVLLLSPLLPLPRPPTQKTFFNARTFDLDRSLARGPDQCQPRHAQQSDADDRRGTYQQRQAE